MLNSHPSPVPPAALEPKAYLVPRQRPSVARAWDVELPTAGTWKVTGAPGSGVSSFLVDTAAAVTRRHAEAGAGDPGGVLVLTDNKASAARLRAELSETLADTGYVADEPMVRSVHSLAFAIVRSSVDEEVRLISGAEQDLSLIHI